MTSSRRFPAALIALALGGFGIGLTEFSVLGLLPEIARDFDVTEATAGWLVSGYALTVAVGALLVTIAVTRIERRTVLLGLLALFIAGNVISAVAGSYATMMLGRVVAALCHGAFFGIGAVVAAGLVDEARKSQAVAVMFTGLTTANVLGVPLGTLLGQQLGWRSTFWAIAVIGVVAIVGIATLVPRTPAPTHAGSGVRGELSAFRAPQVWISLALTILGFGGIFGAFTYIAFTLTDVGGFASGWVPWLLMLFGVGLFAGNWIGGRGADRSVTRTLAVALTGLIVVLALYGVSASSQPLSVLWLLLMGGFGFAMAPALQTRVMRYAGDAPTLASGANIGAFNLGNAIGAWAGGLTISAGLGYTGPLWSGAAMSASALVLLGLTAVRTHAFAAHARSA